jgi:predicted DCC family thiol-disulfide oxidoreductase YuxK
MAAVSLAARVGRLMPKHPFPMKTTFRNCFLVNFRMEPEVLQRVLPRGLTPDVIHGKAFLSVVVADLEDMRLGFLPRALGTTFTQVVHRAIVRSPDGERGVYFVRSDADSVPMSFAGNLFSNFHFNMANAQWAGLEHVPEVVGTRAGSLDAVGNEATEFSAPQGGWLPDADDGAGPTGTTEGHGAAGKQVSTGEQAVHFMLSPAGVGVPGAAHRRAAIQASFDMGSAGQQMPETSLFAGQTVREAQRYFVELYAAFASWDTHWSAVRIERSRWNLHAVEHLYGQYDFMQGSEAFPPGACELDSVFYVHDLDYHWHPLDKQPWRHPELAADAAHVTTVYYDGSCALCRREIGMYVDQHDKHCSGWKQGKAAPVLSFHDVSTLGVGPLAFFDIEKAEAQAQMHVVDQDGVLHTGAHAFFRIWAQLPYWNVLATSLEALPLGASIAEGVYAVFARVRMALRSPPAAAAGGATTEAQERVVRSAEEVQSQARALTRITTELAQAVAASQRGAEAAAPGGGDDALAEISRKLDHITSSMGAYCGSGSGAAVQDQLGTGQAEGTKSQPQARAAAAGVSTGSDLQTQQPPHPQPSS